MRTLICSARVIDPASGLDRTADIAIADGRIAAIDRGLSASPADRVIDARGLIAAPGLIDPHVHLREPGQTHKEDLASGSAAAVAGGFATVCCMPNTTPALDAPELVEWVLSKSRTTAACRVFPVAAATTGRKGEHMSEIASCARAGAVGISDDGEVVASAGMMRQVLQNTAHAGLAFMQHCQEPTLTAGASMHAGQVALRLGLLGWPREAEEIIIERDIRLNRPIHCRYHVQHISSGHSVEIVRRARAEGQPVTAEASPHHLTLTHEACAWPDGHSYNADAKMNPPLREQADVDALIAGVADGTITILATDHAPHTPDEKARPFEEAPFGIIGLESALGLYYDALVAPGHIDWPALLALMTIHPARLCNLDRAHRGDEGLGELFVGGPADLTLIDPACRWTFSESDIHSKSRNTPFLGRAFQVRAVATLVAGTVRSACGCMAERSGAAAC
ncbi:MAG: dihydroorotase [Phycisphaerales bacterium]|nr:dihydroorotase [Phycisphaerales bacterium]